MAKTSPKTKPPQKGNVRFVKKITLKSGRVLYAEDYGYVAWPIRIRSGALRRGLKRKR